MWGLLVDLMRSDTEKHVDILRFILWITSPTRIYLQFLLATCSLAQLLTLRPLSLQSVGQSVGCLDGW